MTGDLQQGETAEQSGPMTVREDVRFTGASAALAGTLIAPRTAGPHAALVVVHDAGDQSARKLRPLAKALARAGVAALIYDKRGVGESTGDWRSGDFGTLAGDALAGVRLLRSRGGVDPARVGLLGIGEGGWIAPLAAAREPAVAFVITISAPLVSPTEQERYRRTMALRSAGQGRTVTTVVALLWLLACALWRHVPEPRKAPPSLHRYFVRVSDFDPLPLWERIHQPVLALWGGQDDRVPPRGSAWLLRRTLKQSGHPASVTAITPEAGHLLETPGQPSSAAADTLATLVASWLRGQPAAKA